MAYNARGLDNGLHGKVCCSFERTFDSQMTPSMPKRAAPPRVTQGKLRRILHHAAQVFSEKGYEGASIRDISRASGVSLAGMYYYVESKQKLLYLIQIYTFKTILARLEKRLSGVTDPEEKLRILVHNHLDYFMRNPVEMKVLSHEDEALEGEYRKEVLEIKRRYYNIALAIFDEMRKAGMARRMNSRVAVLSLFGMMNWIHTWHRPQVDPQADALADTLAGMFLHGVMNGHDLGRLKAARVGRSNISAREQAAG
jgi:TetR/AcrR family transcriptional regulator, cholesterol catabolism regulator